MDNHLWKYDSLKEIIPGNRPQVLLVGNGINRLYDAKSWKTIICDVLSRNRSAYSYDDIKNLPATMQIVIAASGGHASQEYKKSGINQEVIRIANDLRIKTEKVEQTEFIKKVLSLPVDTILTTNYSNEFEVAVTGKTSLYEFRKTQIRTKGLASTEEKFRLYQCSLPGDFSKPIWHIHGDISKPESIIIGHYYYGKLLKHIEERVPALMRHYKTCLKQNRAFTPLSWIDYFLIGDVYIFGLSMSLSEEDLWWLLACKQKLFPETKTIYYSSEEKIDKDIKKMLIAYNAEPKTDISISECKNDYNNYYIKIIEDINAKINDRNNKRSQEDNVKICN